ncbi:STAS-like domain-containing protein [Methanolapillus millepedarum]|uniref:DUF4325 domain-containing protein n=1 Tax=Methanolapillus millepedarum TaxID=3028296 RepID=A0AA96ZVQ4_9EURY|nr:hypothetical protein MsAc7_12590 [Methanosarcinaceae archaeon Ac7]
MNKLNVRQIVNDGMGVMSTDGKKVYAEIKREIEKNGKAIVSFKDFEIVTGNFLNGIVWKFPEDFNGKNINDLIEFVDISDGNRKLICSALRDAELCYRYPKEYEEIMNQFWEEFY